MQSNPFFCTIGGNMEQKNFQDLNLNNSMLFSAALGDEETCRLILECILDCDISSLVVHTEHNILFSSDFKYIRLDVFGKDRLDISYDLEMQNENEGNLSLRSRYYQAELDLSSLKPGENYEQLKPLYVIFICSFDPFGKQLYRYTFEMQCNERDFPLNDGVKRIFLNTKGKNKDEVSPLLVEFLGYLEDSTDSYISKANCDKLKKIHERILQLKKNRDLKERYMRFEEYLKQNAKKAFKQGLEEGREQGREQGMQEGIQQGYSEIFTLMKVMKENGEEKLIPKLSEDAEFLKSKLQQYLI